MRDYKIEFENRVAFIKKLLSDAGATAIVFGNSGGKDSALVGILCRAACEDVLGIIMPCESKQNYGSDMDDAHSLAMQFGISGTTIDLTGAKLALMSAINRVAEVSDAAQVNIAPRLRMTTLYAVAQTKNALVAGTGNRSETYLGYFTKWGDGAHDFNPISDLTVSEVYEFLDYLNAPENIRIKAPSAGLYEGQTDEKDMGLSYADVDKYLLSGEGDAETIENIEMRHKRTKHKLEPIRAYARPDAQK